MKDFLKKYKFDILLYGCIIASLYLNFIYFYYQIESPLTLPNQASGPIFYTLVNCLLFSLPYFFQRKKILFFFIYLLFIDLLFIANLVYFRNYGNVIPLFSYYQVYNLNGLGNSIISSLRLSDVLPVISTVACFLVYRLYLKPRYVGVQQGKHRLVICSSIIGLSICMVFAGTAYTKLKGIPFYQKFGSIRTNQPHFVSYYGIVPYWSYQLYSFLHTDNLPLTKKEKAEIEQFIAKSNASTHGTTCLPACNKNLIVIIVESLDTWVTKYNNGEATPFLHKLAQQPDVIYAPNVLPQVNHSRSADAQLMINTGLLPPAENAVTNLYSKNYFPSLPDALREKKNYFSFTIMGNNAVCWNQKTMNQTYRFNKLFSIENLKKDEILGLGLSDKTMFKQTAQKLKHEIKQPFYAQIVTLSSHDWDDFTSRPTTLKFPTNYPLKIKDYIKSLQYTDSAIELFFNELKNSHILENSIVVIIGDHDGLSSDLIRPYNPNILNPLEKNGVTFIPLYIVNAPKAYKQAANHVMQEVDIYPTLLDIMGISNYYWKGVGHSLFSSQPSTTGVNKFFKVIGNEQSQDINRQLEAWKISDLIIRKDYFKNNHK